MTSDNLYREPYRPQFHFSPARNWMNDPNGLVYYAGEYHLFFQCNPDGLDWDWRKLHWGHAISTDLLHWREFPLAVFPDAIGTILSGSVVVDIENTAGFKTGADNPLITIYTSGSEGNIQHPWDAFQQQSIAFSNDRGRTWTQYDGNPVIPNPGLADFRDPKVFWHAPSEAWVMVLAAGDRVRFYQSLNLKSWTQVGEFGADCGAHGGPWECPDLFPLAVERGSGNRWVLIISGQRGGTLPRSGTQYFVGQFDGRTFANDHPAGLILWLDHGPDNNAGATWSNIPSEDARRLFIGWMSGANRGPTRPWRGAMTVPRELRLEMIRGQVRLVQNPVRELVSLRQTAREWHNEVIGPSDNLLAGLSGQQYEIVAEFSLEAARATQFGFRLRSVSGQGLTIACDLVNRKLVLDRSSAGLATLQTLAGASAIDEVSLTPAGAALKLHILVDSSSVEVFVNDGEIAMTACFFPDPEATGVELYALDGTVRLNRLAFYPLSSATPATD